MSCSIFTALFLLQQQSSGAAYDYTENMRQLSANIMSEEVKPHVNDFLDISWFFMDALQVL